MVRNVYVRLSSSEVDVSKAVILPESDQISVDDDFMVFMPSHSGGWHFGRNRDEYFTHINEDKLYYNDIAV